MRRGSFACALVILAFSLLSGLANAQDETSFSFVALGDMPYGPAEKVYPPFRALIAEINDGEPAFTIHIGDTKASARPCSDEALLDQLGFMNSFDGALIYTPGDNEWTDCHGETVAWPNCPRNDAGDCDPRDRLAFIRDHFFSHGPTSLGGAPIGVERQSDVAPAHGMFVETARFTRHGVPFVTIHVVGSNNNHDVPAEFGPRDRANIEWLDDSVDRAIAAGAKTMVLAIHANMFQDGFYDFDAEEFLQDTGFTNFGEALRAKAIAFGRPLLVIYGDSHIYRITRPFAETAPNLVALEVFGGKDMHAVTVTVAPDEDPVFSFEPLLNPALTN